MKIISVIICYVLLIPLSCTTINHSIPDKYNLDVQLIRVNKITDLPVGRIEPENLNHGLLHRGGRLTNSDNQGNTELYYVNCQLLKIDEQSLILRGGPEKNYLLVLKNQAPQILLKHDIKIITSGWVITEKTDYIIIGGNFRCPIERIYLIGSDEQAASIKNQLLGKPVKYFPPKKIRLI